MDTLRLKCIGQQEELTELRQRLNLMLDLIQEFESRSQHMMEILSRQRRTIQRGCVLQPPSGIVYGGQTKDVACQTD